MTAIGTAERVDTPGARGRSPVRDLGMPVFLVLVGLALYLWVGTLELDSIEQRVLNAPVLRTRVLEHLYLIAWSTVIVIALAVPLGIAATRPGTRRFAPLVLGLGNAGLAIPSLGVIVILAVAFGFFGPRGAIAALVAYAFLPVLRNTIVGLQQVDAAVIEAGRGMGMTKGSVLRRIELPLAVPVVFAGVRTALVINVGTAAIAALTNAGGLGFVILQGINQNRVPIQVVGAVSAALLALSLDYLGGLAEERLKPRGL